MTVLDLFGINSLHQNIEFNRIYIVTKHMYIIIAYSQFTETVIFWEYLALVITFPEALQVKFIWLCAFWSSEKLNWSMLLNVSPRFCPSFIRARRGTGLASSLIHVILKEVAAFTTPSGDTLMVTFLDGSEILETSLVFRQDNILHGVYILHQEQNEMKLYTCVHSHWMLSLIEILYCFSLQITLHIKLHLLSYLKQL